MEQLFFSIDSRGKASPWDVKKKPVFTRNTIPNVVDAKRCAHSRGFRDGKLEKVKEATKLSELKQGNAFPGITRCVESCGGPGCGRFYLSSGCLFYKIFQKPDDDDIFEIFRCQSWKETVALEVRVDNSEGEPQ
uniref:Phlebovirus_G2 domain-containing protein n=1 Tax=Haemonchus contortus TaxID=6289 RepID=A0A7I4XVV1_HAECO